MHQSFLVHNRHSATIVVVNIERIEDNDLWVRFRLSLGPQICGHCIKLRLKNTA